VAFYAGIEQYESFFEAHGFLSEARRLQKEVKKGHVLDHADLVPDEMVRTFVLCGSPERVREQVERAWKIADSLVLVPPAYALPMEKLAAYAEQTAKMFYTGA
jgi:alkanesulfonate monooxygenase SsuD/methylene tetrahydromethanopterin reductase-like flavin-dependent oxidoreductase (luciferase family)